MQVAGIVTGIALKTAHGGSMQEVHEATTIVHGGLKGSASVGTKRGVTFLSREQWEATLREIGTELPWYSRRANVLVEGADLSSWIGRIIRVGEAELRIHGETRPCQRMDQEYRGLREALSINCRAGVYGQVLRGGRIRVGDSISLH